MKKKEYPEEYTKCELSCRVIKPVLYYIMDKYNREVLVQFIEETGLDLDFLENENNWVSFNYYNLVLGKMVEFTKNPMSPFEAGYYVLSKESYGMLYSILSVLKVFGTPKIAYQQVAELGSTFNNICKITILESGMNNITMSWKYLPGFKQTKLNCLNIRGQLAYIPGFWGLPNAEIEELKCEADGDDACVFRIHWNRVIKKEWIQVGVICALLAGVFVFYFLEPVKWLKPKDLIISALSALLSIACFWLRKYVRIIDENKKLNVKRSEALEQSLESLQSEYRKLDEANCQTLEEAKKLSILKDIAESVNHSEGESDTIRNVIQILIDRIGFDRGYCLLLNDHFELLKVPNFVRKHQEVPLPAFPNYEPADWRRLLSDFNMGLDSSGGGFRIIKLEAGNYSSLVMPVIVGVFQRHFFVFDNPDSANMLDDSYRPFFVTVSNQLQAALNRIQAEDAAKSVMASIPSSIAVFDLETLSIIFCNQAFLQDIGSIPDSIVGMDILETIGIDKQETRTMFLEQVSELPTKKLIDYKEFSLKNQTFGYTLFLMPDFSSGRVEAGIIMKNITSQNELKEQLFRAEKMAALGTLVSGVAHEINNPLYGILGNAEIVRDEAPTENIRDSAKSIIEFTVRISDIVKDLSAYSRSMREEKPVMADLNTVMEEALKIVSYNKSFINIRFDKQFGKIPPIFALAGELTQIYVNLFNNSIDAMKGKGVITLSSCYEDGSILTSVRDTGGGIPGDQITKIFDPFFTTKETGKGTGLGLSIVYRLVTKYDGVISVHSEEGKGTIFYIRFSPGSSHV
jgi:signal transduction histidine kinase